MASKRSYGDACGIARALDVVGERWALMVVRELLLGPKRFTDIRGGLPHVSPDVLAQRLRDLEQAGIVHHRRLPPPYASQVYELTDSGRALEPVADRARPLGRRQRPGAQRRHVHESGRLHRLAADAVRPRARGDFAARVELRLGDDRFRVVIDDGHVEASRGELPDADAVIEAEPRTLLDVLHGHRPLAAALASGDMRLSGDKRAAKRFTQLFPLPAPALVG